MSPEIATVYTIALEIIEQDCVGAAPIQFMKIRCLRFDPSQSVHIVAISFALFIGACGGGSGPSPAPAAGAPPATYVVGGTVSGLASGASLVLQDNGGNDTSVSANGAFSFSKQIASGAAYVVTVLTQPQGQTCTVSNGSGTIAAAGRPISVSCAAATIKNTWAWLSGSDMINQAGTYGTKGVASTANAPGGRYFASAWTDASGNLWMFGGSNGNGSNGFVSFLNDLWEYADGQWKWVGGSNTANAAGIYGAKGSSAAANMPGARLGASTWTDLAGNFWLFSGVGYASDPTQSFYLADLWEYSGGQWKWVAGPNGSATLGVYGNKGMAAMANTPGGREYASTWKDASGNFWLFGGFGYDSVGALGQLNDLWEYSGGIWTWIAGAQTVSAPGSYGTPGMASATNTPGARVGAGFWTDASGNFWMFGGAGYDSAATFGALNDLWKFSAGQWTWVGGSSTVNATGNYGNLGAAAPDNFPGARSAPATWTDASGNFWMFGGGGYGADLAAGQGFLNDIWEYSAGQWTWMGGPSSVGSTGSYGAQGTAVAGNVPMSRNSATTWTDASGNLWLFGGTGVESTFTSSTTIDVLNDLWRFTP